MDMDQRTYTDGCLNYEGVPSDGFSHLYAGDIEINFESVVARQTSIKPENEELVAVEEETRSTSPSPREHGCQILVGELLRWRIHPSLKTWRRIKDKCAKLKVI